MDGRRIADMEQQLEPAHRRADSRADSPCPPRDGDRRPYDWTRSTDNAIRGRNPRLRRRTEDLLSRPGACLQSHPWLPGPLQALSLIHISEPTRLRRISYAVF